MRSWRHQQPIPMLLSPGTILGPYEVLEVAGTGGMGEVYKARDVRLRRIVALKVLSRDLEEDPASRQRLAREARAIAALNHPNICAIHDVGEHEGHDFLVMEFLDGQTLEQRLAKGPLPVEEALAVAMQIAGALEAAHRAGVVHRDVKPSNVMLTRGGVKLLDFGIAKRSSKLGIPESPETVATLRGELIGTVPYMAPEQLEGGPLDGRTDIFAFGAVMFEMVTGRRAFGRGSPAAVIAAILSDTGPRVPPADPPLPRQMERVVAACLAVYPGDRFQDVTDLRRELAWAHEDIAAGSAHAPSRARRRWAVHAVWLSVLVAALVASTAWNLSGRNVLPPANETPVVVLMDSPLPGRVYDARTAAAGLTNADDVTDALAGLPIAIRKENTSALWHREEQVVSQNPDLLVTHLSALLDARVGADQPDVAAHLFDQAENRLLLFLAYLAARNPRTRFIVYSRTVFQRAGGAEQWAARQEARLPVLQGRLTAFIVPGGLEHASFRDEQTARILRETVAAELGLTASTP
jgi:hypothetical protein